MPDSLERANTPPRTPSPQGGGKPALRSLDDGATGRAAIVSLPLVGRD